MQNVLEEFKKRVGHDDWYYPSLPVFDNNIIGYMRVVEDQPFIFSFIACDPDKLEKPIYKLPPNYSIFEPPDRQFVANVNRKTRNGSRNRANTI